MTAQVLLSFVDLRRWAFGAKATAWDRLDQPRPNGHQLARAAVELGSGLVRSDCASGRTASSAALDYPGGRPGHPGTSRSSLGRLVLRSRVHPLLRPGSAGRAYLAVRPHRGGEGYYRSCWGAEKFVCGARAVLRTKTSSTCVAAT
jgi:hypothetical protein